MSVRRADRKYDSPRASWPLQPTTMSQFQFSFSEHPRSLHEDFYRDEILNDVFIILHICVALIDIKQKI